MINTAIQSTDKNVLADVIDLQNANKSSGVHFKTLLQFAHLLIFLNIQMDFIIIKHRRRAVYFSNQKMLHLILKAYSTTNLGFTVAETIMTAYQQNVCNMKPVMNS